MRTRRWLLALGILVLAAGLTLAGCRLLTPGGGGDASPTQNLPLWSSGQNKPSPTMEVPPPRN